MKTKKFLSMVLALAMIFTLSVSVFASSSSSNEFTADATVVIPAISVTVPQTGKIFINPMKFSLKVGYVADDIGSDGKLASGKTDLGSTASADEIDTDDGKGVIVSNSQVASPIFYIENNSPMNLDVTVNPLATVDSSAKALSIAAAPGLKESTKNEVFIYAVFCDEENVDIKDADFSPEWEEADYGAEGKFTAAVPAKAAKEGVEVGTIAKAETTTTGTGQDATTTTTPGVMSMRFLGECAGAPKSEWNNGDKVSVSMTFTFKPSADQD